MNVTAVLKESVRFLIENSNGEIDYDAFEIVDGDLDGSISAVVEEGKISVCFPGEWDWIEYQIGDFIRQVSECKTLQSGSRGMLRTANFAIQVVVPGNERAHAVAHHEMPMAAKTSTGALVRLNYKSLIAGFHAARIGGYHKHGVGSISSHPAVEMDFTSMEAARTNTCDHGIAFSYLFELASSHQVEFQPSDFFTEEDFFEGDWMTDIPDGIKLRPLEIPNHGIELFVAATQVANPELRFLSFFKVLEYFGPVVLNLERNDALRKKLDSPSALSPSGPFLHGLAELVQSFDARRNDRDLAKMVLVTSTDLRELSPLVPAFLHQEITYDTARKDLDHYARAIADAMCATRNQVAHAKSNYTQTGRECPTDALPDFLKFIESACAQVIRWYNRLPEHQKTTPDG